MKAVGDAVGEVVGGTVGEAVGEATCSESATATTLGGRRSVRRSARRSGSSWAQAGRRGGRGHGQRGGRPHGRRVRRRQRGGRRSATRLTLTLRRGGGAHRAEGDMSKARPRCTTGRPASSTTATGASFPMKPEKAHCRVRAWEKPTAPDTGEWGRQGASEVRKRGGAWAPQ